MSFIVYKSSAGSGKTFMLVKEYLKIVLQNPRNFNHTLAITFTNKAAAEMKSRILSALHAIVHKETLSQKEKHKIEQLIGMIESETHLKSSVIQNNAQIALELILHNYSDFAVSTIDSFVLSIVRTFAKDLYLPLNFDIELDSTILLQQAIDVLINRVGADAELTQTLVHFIENKVDSEKGMDVEFEIKKIAFYIFKESSTEHINVLKSISLNDFNTIIKELYKIIDTHENTFKTIANAAIEAIDQSGITPKAFYYKDKGLYNYFKKLSKGDTQSISNKNVEKGILQNKWTSQEATAHDISSIENIKGFLEKSYYQIQQFAENELKHLELFKLMRKNIYPLSVLCEINNIIEEIKTENNLLHISEFNKRIAEIVLNEPVPFIYERIGSRFKHYMVDEFQDTSVLQWMNLLPLIENALAEAGLVMLVGDAKQAIYRWRDGDVEQFVKLPDVYAAHKTDFHIIKENILKSHFIAKELNTNYRSKSEIINFNNDFFSHATAGLNESLHDIYANVKQAYSDNQNGGMVQLRFLNKDGYKDQNLIETKELIQNLIEKEHFAASDIAVLCRTNKNASEVARYLMAHNINVVSSESLLLQSSPHIAFLIASFQFIHNAQDAVARVVMAHYLTQKPTIDIGDTHAFYFQISKDIDIFMSFLNKHFCHFDYQLLKEQSIYELTEMLIRVFDLNKTPNPYLQFFLDSILSFSNKKENNISAFLKWWETHKDKLSVIVPEGENAVNIMSIHKSKGLQFPIVILPFAKVDRVRNTNDNIWLDIEDSNLPLLKSFLMPLSKDLEKTDYAHIYNDEKNKSVLDMLNVLYVALTRPEERLYVLTELPENNRDTFNYHMVFMNYLISKGLWEEGKTVYTFGESNEKEKDEKLKTRPTFTYNELVSNPWQHKLLIQRKAQTIWDIDEPDKTFKYGNLIHTIMSEINTTDDVDVSIEGMLLNGSIDMEQAAKAKETINLIVNAPLLSPYFSKDIQSHNEIEIMDKEGYLFRPDRLILKDNTAVIIDYKTGLPQEADRNQIMNYASILKDCGYAIIKSFLVYIDAEKVHVDEI